MPTMADFLQHIANGWLFIPGAMLLGALHGLEPGHSKTMIASYIVAIRGNIAQGILLGLAATISHTTVVWIIALASMYFGLSLDSNAAEPYFQLASASLIIGIALWMFWRTLRNNGRESHTHNHAEFTSHSHTHTSLNHEAAYAGDIRYLTNRDITMGQLLVFGLTGGLVPCSAAITVLILCLQLKKIAMGALLVLSFSTGLALTLISSGVLAALSVRYAIKAWPGFGEFAHKAPYFSSGIILLAGLYIGYSGLHALR